MPLALSTTLDLGFCDPEGCLEVSAAELILPYPVRRLTEHQTVDDVDEATVREMAENAPAPAPLPEMADADDDEPPARLSISSASRAAPASFGRGTAARAAARKMVTAGTARK